MEIKNKSAQNENKFSALISLIKRESIEEIKEILHKWTQLLAFKDQSGRTALHYCSEHSSALCADFILEKCPNLLTEQDNEGYTALHLSVISGNQVMTRYLITKSDANYLNQCDFENHTSIHWATVCGQLQCLDLLSNSGAHSSRADIHGAYPLHYSAQMCSPYSGICIGNDSRVGLTVLNRLLQCSDVDVDCIDSDGRTPLLWAASAEIGVSKINCSSGSAEAILALINAGANVSAKDKDGLTALHCASSRGHIDCVETLLTLCGAEINQMDTNGCPPLFYAVTLGHADCTRLLIESGADVNVQDFKGRTAAHCGAARGQFETIKILGQLGANLWLRNTRGDLPLHEAVKSGRKELVKWLLDQIPSAVNATNSFGRSALHIAAINNNIEMCKILIDIGADVNTVMKMKGHFITPLDASLQKGYRGVAKYLLLHGALPATRISQSLNKTSAQRCPSGRPLENNFPVFDNNSPIDSYDEWKARSQSTDSALHSQSQMNPNLENSRTQLPKLPTLVKNSGEEQHIQETSSSTPSSLMENISHYKNVREFDTPLNDKPSNLKQAIITNVYVTNTPICHSKRVPPLKKVKKKRKTIPENEELKGLRVYTPSTMSSSSSMINDEDNVNVVMEARDDSSFKLNESSNEKSEAKEENRLDSDPNESEDQNPIEIQRDSEELVSKEISEPIEDLQQKSEDEVTADKNIDTIEVMADLDEKPEELIDSNKKEVTVEDNKNSVSQIKSQNSDEQVQIDRKTSLKSSELTDKSNQSSGKSNKPQEVLRQKRSVSRRRSSVTSVKSIQSVNKEKDVKQKSVENKTNDTKSQKSEDKSSEKSSVNSTKIRARKELEEKSKDLSENIEKQTKVVTKTNKRKELSGKLNKSDETANKFDTCEQKSTELSGVDTQSDEKIIENEKQTDDNRDIDSITYIKSDNESVKSNVSSVEDKNQTKVETNAEEIETMTDLNENTEDLIDSNKDQQQQQQKSEDEVTADKNVDKIEGMTDLDEKPEELIDCNEKEVADKDNKNSISKIKSQNSDEQVKNDRKSSLKSSELTDKSNQSSGKSKKSQELKEFPNETENTEQKPIDLNENDVKTEETPGKLSVIKSEDKGEYDEYYDQWESDSEKTVIDSKIVLDEHKSIEDFNNNYLKSSDAENNQKSNKITVKSNKNVVSKTQKPIKNSSKENSIKSNYSSKVRQKKAIEPKERTETKTTDKGKDDSDKSVKSNRSSIASNKRPERKGSEKERKDNEPNGLTSGQIAKPSDKKPPISRGKPDMSYNKKAIEKKTTNQVSKVKSKSDKTMEPIQQSVPLESTGFLSTSDVSLNKSSDLKNDLNSSHLKTSVSNQELTDLNHNINKNVGDFSSDESIFDSSLVMADMERDDSRMYSDIDKICAEAGESISPLEHIQRQSDSPTREQLDVCDDYCNGNHKPNSRCSHKLHFKTMPAHLGKVEVAHIGSRVDSRRDNRYQIPNKYSRGSVRRVRRVRHSSDGYKAIDPNIITQTVEKSLRKYQLERKLFEELHELKRFQIRSGKSNEILMVKRLVDKFRRDVKAPGMTDFSGHYTYKNYELYLYDQLRRLSTSNEGKVALITRWSSHENIQLIRNSNENITQSSPEIMQNSVDLDINIHQNILNSKAHEIHTTGYQNISVSEANGENQTIDSTKEDSIEILDKKHVLESIASVENQFIKDLGNDRHFTDNFDNESKIDSIVKSEQIIQLAQCDFAQNITQNSTHYQNSEVSENIRITEEVSHIIIDRNLKQNLITEQKSQTIELQNQTSDLKNENLEQIVSVNQISEQNDPILLKLDQTLAEKIDQISNDIITEAINQQISTSFDSESDFNKQNKTKTNKSLSQTTQTSVESNKSRKKSKQISDAKSTIGSIKSGTVERRSQYSSVSRKPSSKTIKTTNKSIPEKRIPKQRQCFKKECLKQVKDMEPSERALNRKKIKRLKTTIPLKTEINISIDEIKNRWKDIKESELKKLLILSEYKPIELNTGFILWFELNKSSKKRNKSIDSQIDRYISENRTGLQRTHSDSYLNKYNNKLDSDFISFDKTIK